MNTFAEELEAIEHHKALGNTSVHLPHTVEDQPWDRVTLVKPGGTHRLDMETSLRFEYAHPEGVTFSWFIDVESRDANGSGSYRFEVERLAQILAKLPAPAAKQMQEYLARAADTVQAKGDEWMSIVQKQYGDAEVLRSLAARSTSEQEAEG